MRWEVMRTIDRNKLMMPDGTIALGVTDRSEQTICIYDNLNDIMLKKVLTHELVHAWIFSYRIFIDVAQEEFICQFFDLYGFDIINQVVEILNLWCADYHYNYYYV